MSYKILTLKDKDDWLNYISILPRDQQDIYYTPEYYSLYEEFSYGKAMCFVFEKNKDIALYPFLINSVNQLGYILNNEYYDIQGAYGYNGVVSSNHSQSFINSFFCSFNRFCKDRNIIAEFIRFNPYIRNHRFKDKNIQTILNRKTVMLYLDKGYSNIWTESYSSNNRNMIRKSRKNKYKMIIDNSIDGVNNFYDVYLQTMKIVDAESYYYFNLKLFQNMIKNDGFDFLFVRDDKNILLAAMILIKYGDYAHYHLSGRTTFNKDNSVNNFILDEAVKLALFKRARIFHFGGGKSLENDDSLFRFKKNFSKDYLNFYIGKKLHNLHIYNEVVKQWKEKFPLHYENHKNKVLGYRGIENKNER